MYNQSGKQFVPSFKLSDLQLAKEVTSDTSGKDGRAGGRLTYTNCPFCPPPQKKTTTTNASYTIWERPPGPIFSHTLLPTHVYQALPIRVAMPSGHRGRTAQCHRSVPCTRFPERPHPQMKGSDSDTQDQHSVNLANTVLLTKTPYTPVQWSWL